MCAVSPTSGGLFALEHSGLSLQEQLPFKLRPARCGRVILPARLPWDDAPGHSKSFPALNQCADVREHVETQRTQEAGKPTASDNGSLCPFRYIERGEQRERDDGYNAPHGKSFHRPSLMSLGVGAAVRWAAPCCRADSLAGTNSKLAGCRKIDMAQVTTFPRARFCQRPRRAATLRGHRFLLLPFLYIPQTQS